MRLDLGRSNNKLSAFNNALSMAQAASAAAAAATIAQGSNKSENWRK
jgi:hypothetical protein